MRDEGLRLAIEAAGGVGALARGLGIRQPSVSSWTRVPVERIGAVEALTGVARERLRPDLYDASQAAAPLDDIEHARSIYYLLLGKLLRSAPSQALLGEAACLTGDGSPFGMSLIELAEAASRADERSAAEEFFALFVGIGRGEILPYASFYLTGFLHERPLAVLREDLARHGIERSECNFDPEDHLGILLEVMGGFASGTFAGDLGAQRAFFQRHIEPWGARCFADIQTSPSARFYRAVGRLGEEFLAMERDAFALEN